MVLDSILHHEVMFHVLGSIARHGPHELIGAFFFSWKGGKGGGLFEFIYDTELFHVRVYLQFFSYKSYSTFSLFFVLFFVFPRFPLPWLKCSVDSQVSTFACFPRIFRV